MRAALSLALVVGVAAVARADGGRFAPTASMHIPRNGARAVSLGGAVLVIGGENEFEGPLRGAELWVDGDGGKDSKPSWSPAGRMRVPRVGHTLTALDGERVLVVGGGGSDPEARLAELWGEGDWEIKTFKPAGRLSVSRKFHTATLLRDGRVLVIGGRDPRDRPLATAELWDPKRRTFTAAGRLRLARCCHTATLLDDGRVLVVGGRVAYADPDVCEKGEPCFNTTASVELWDPRTRAFTDGPTLDIAGGSSDFSDRAAHTATKLPDGRVLIMGGAGAFEPDPVALRRPTAYLWDHKGSRWSEIPGMGRDYHTSTLLPDGRVLIVGGASNICGCCKPVPRQPGVKYLDGAVLWDPVTGALSDGGSGASARMNHAAALLPDGRVLIAGGTAPEYLVGFGEASASAEIWQPAK